MSIGFEAWKLSYKILMGFLDPFTPANKNTSHLHLRKSQQYAPALEATVDMLVKTSNAAEKELDESSVPVSQWKQRLYEHWSQR